MLVTPPSWDIGPSAAVSRWSGASTFSLQALRRTLAEAHGVLGLRKVECNEEAWIVHREGEALGVGQHGGGERYGEQQRQRAVLVLQPVVPGLAQLQGLAGQGWEGEVVEVLQRIDIDLGQLGQLLTRVDAVVVLVEALDGARRVVLVEGPLVADADEGAVLVEQSRLHRHPDVRVRGGRQAGQQGRRNHGDAPREPGLETSLEPSLQPSLQPSLEPSLEHVRSLVRALPPPIQQQKSHRKTPPGAPPAPGSALGGPPRAAGQTQATAGARSVPRGQDTAVRGRDVNTPSPA